MRLFVNDNRVSTAVKTKAGSILQVYPTKVVFKNDTEWRIHWENKLKPKITLKTSDSVPSAPKPKVVSKNDWEFSGPLSTVTLTLPPGKYYIGDLCYVLGKDVYDKVFGGYDYEMGIYKEKATGYIFAMNGTAYGDGEYPGSDGKKFCVDAGIIGICPISLMAKNDGGGHIYTFRNEVVCTFKHGRFFFDSGLDSLVVDTTGDDDDEY